jgi:signal recognition particle GTPase
MKKLGGMKGVLGMLPGVGKIKTSSMPRAWTTK